MRILNVGAFLGAAAVTGFATSPGVANAAWKTFHPSACIPACGNPSDCIGTWPSPLPTYQAANAGGSGWSGQVQNQSSSFQLTVLCPVEDDNLHQVINTTFSPSAWLAGWANGNANNNYQIRACRTFQTPTTTGGTCGALTTPTTNNSTFLANITDLSAWTGSTNIRDSLYLDVLLNIAVGSPSGIFSYGIATSQP
jgi:hypothetical protein